MDTEWAAIYYLLLAVQEYCSAPWPGYNPKMSVWIIQKSLEQPLQRWSVNGIRFSWPFESRFDLPIIIDEEQ